MKRALNREDLISIHRAWYDLRKAAHPAKSPKAAECAMKVGRFLWVRTIDKVEAAFGASGARLREREGEKRACQTSAGGGVARSDAYRVQRAAADGA